MNVCHGAELWQVLKRASEAAAGAVPGHAGVREPGPEPRASRHESFLCGHIGLAVWPDQLRQHQRALDRDGRALAEPLEDRRGQAFNHRLGVRHPSLVLASDRADLHLRPFARDEQAGSHRLIAAVVACHAQVQDGAELLGLLHGPAKDHDAHFLDLERLEGRDTAVALKDDAAVDPTGGGVPDHRRD